MASRNNTKNEGKRYLLSNPECDACSAGEINLFETTKLCATCIIKVRKLANACETKNQQNAAQYANKRCIQDYRHMLTKDEITLNKCSHCKKPSYVCKNCDIANASTRSQSLCVDCSTTAPINRIICFQCCNTVNNATPENMNVTCSNCEVVPIPMCDWCASIWMQKKFCRTILCRKCEVDQTIALRSKSSFKIEEDLTQL